MSKATSDKKQSFHFESNPLWYKDAVIYEVHVRAFFDSNDDGIGDFKGLTEKLDYLQDLGVTAIWILPFYPSPLRDDGYDISDYNDVHPSYGTLKDFKIFVREANRRKLHIITEMVLNHTSDQHQWFQAARKAKPGSRARERYVWSKTTERYQDTRIIFQDFEHSNWTYDSVAGEYFWHRFYSHQPDLNYANPAVRREMLQALDDWFDMGIAGMRLDAVPYLYEEEGTNCENLPETHAFLKELRAHLDKRFRGRMLLAEANMWPEDAAAYFGDGDECHMNFHFPLMPRLFMSLHMEDRYPIIDILQQTPEIAETCQWATFLRNHDELTLEMVTDEERDYMYRVYANDKQSRINFGIRRRLAPLLGNNRRKIELINALLFSLPGTPVIYYGDEIGMGDNFFLGDRNSVRTPMQWSSDRNAGFSRANPQQLYLPIVADPEYRPETVNVETQQRNPHSLLWWMKRLIGLRKRYPAFSRGTLEVLNPENRKVLAFVRRHGDQAVLCVHNLSRFVQYLELDLAEFEGKAPIELFGRTRFPAIGTSPYFLTLGPHGFYLFSLETVREEGAVTNVDVLAKPPIEIDVDWNDAFRQRAPEGLEQALAEYLSAQRWFRSKAQEIKSAAIVEAMPFRDISPAGFLVIIKVEYIQHAAETYMMMLSSATGDTAARMEVESPKGSIVARMRTVEGGKSVEDGIIYDALTDRRIGELLLNAIRRRKKFRGWHGQLSCTATAYLQEVLGKSNQKLEPTPVRTEQSNTSIIYGESFVLKMFRRLEGGLNLDLEIGRYLTEHHSFPHTPKIAGSMEYRVPGKDAEPVTVGIMQEFVANEGDAWSYTMDELNRYLDRVITEVSGKESAVIPAGSLLQLTGEEPPKMAIELIESYLEIARLMGQRVAEMHLVLGAPSDRADSAFGSESFPPHYQRSLFQTMRNLCVQNFQLLKKKSRELSGDVRRNAQEVLSREPEVLARLRSIVEKKVVARRIRCHGDLHLGQLLFTGRDFIILDFEGEPARSLSERRIKRSPLRDVAGMLRSFHYAVYTFLNRKLMEGAINTENREEFEQWMRFWYVWTSHSFLRSYLKHVESGDFLPRRLETSQALLDVFLLEKAIYELGYELNNRPAWVEVPLKGILQQLDEQPA